MYQPRLSLSSVLGGLFARGVNSAPHSRENGWSPGCPVPCFMQTKSKLIANKTPPGTWCMLEALIVSSKPWIDACWWRGSINFYHSVGEPPIMCLAWKISPSLSCYVDNESIPLKMQFTSISKLSSGTSTNPCFPLRRSYPFTFMLSHHPLIKKH